MSLQMLPEFFAGTGDVEVDGAVFMGEFAGAVVINFSGFVIKRHCSMASGKWSLCVMLAALSKHGTQGR